MKIFPCIALAIVWFFVGILLSSPVFGQAGCLTPEEAQQVVNRINSTQNIKLDKKLRDELLKMQEARQDLDRKIIDNWNENQKLVPAAYEMGEKNLRRVCELVKTSGWLGTELVGDEAAEAALYLIKNNKAVNLQREIFPVVVAAAKKGYVRNSQVASLIDIIRTGSNQPQIFGTQTKIRDEMFYLYPLLNEKRVDEWRKMYDLPPLAVFIKSLQAQFQMPVLKSPAPVFSPATEKKQVTANSSIAPTEPLPNFDMEEVVKVESNLVNLNVRVSSNDPANQNFQLQKSDFTVFENGKEQEIEFFSSAETPFDLILLIDLSGSTAGKKDLIRQSTRRFIEAARPSDRIAIVTFTDRTQIVVDLTQNRAELLDGVKRIDDTGGSGVWGGLQFVYEKIIKPESAGRRSAVVMMTDGVDSSLLRNALIPPEYPIFSDVLDMVRENDTAVIPVYLDTEIGAGDWEKRAYRSARQTLGMLAEASGNQMYYAKKVDDLNGVYEKVINDLGKVYSLGYQPTDEVRDGAWRALTVKINKHPDLQVRAKTGYFAK